MRRLTKILAGSALALSMGGEAYANAVVQPGETSGLASGAPLPEGVYFVNTLDWGVIKRPGEDIKVQVDIPILAWSTPWTIFGGNLQIIGALPNIHLDLPGGAGDDYGLYNPIIATRIAFDLGGGFGFSYLVGNYFNAGTKGIQQRTSSLRQDVAISYTANGWNLTAALISGLTYDTDKGAGGKTSNGFNLDLTATKTFGKWEFGAVGFGTTEFDLPEFQKKRNGGPGKAERFAVGPLVGYNFGPVILQAYLTRDVYAKNTTVGTRGGDNGKDTRFWSRIIIPLWAPETPAAPLVTKY